MSAEQSFTPDIATLGIPEAIDPAENLLRTLQKNAAAAKNKRVVEILNYMALRARSDAIIAQDPTLHPFLKKELLSKDEQIERTSHTIELFHNANVATENGMGITHVVQTANLVVELLHANENTHFTREGVIWFTSDAKLQDGPMGQPPMTDDALHHRVTQGVRDIKDMLAPGPLYNVTPPNEPPRNRREVGITSLGLRVIFDRKGYAFDIGLEKTTPPPLTVIK